MPNNLLEGFKVFRKTHYEDPNATMHDLIQNGQNPDYFIISCIDSRANPGTIFNALPGTFFAHKAMGAIVRPYKKGTALAAALQFALNYNNVTSIIVLGHTGCGAVKALIDKIDDDEITSFIDVAQSGLNRAKHICAAHSANADIYRTAEEQIILESAKNLKSYPSVIKALAEKKVTIKAWLFDMNEGALMEHSDTQDTFIPITHKSGS